MSVVVSCLRPGRETGTIVAFALSLAVSIVLGGCGAEKPSAAPGYEPMTPAEMRLRDAGGPSAAATPAGIASPVAAPPPLGPQALTDAGPNTPLGKQWMFTMVAGYRGTPPGPPKSATLLMSRGNGRVIGSTSCNPLSATFEINVVSATLRFKNIARGRAMCGQPNIDVQDAVLEAMAITDSFLMDGKVLTLKSKGHPVAELTTP